MSEEQPRNRWSDFADGFTEEERQVPVDPASPLGRAMAEARDAEPLAPDFKFDPIPVNLKDDE